MLVFEEKTGQPGEKPLAAEGANQQTQPTYDAESGNRTRDTLVKGRRSHKCATLLPRKINPSKYTCWKAVSATSNQSPNNIPNHIHQG